MILYHASNANLPIGDNLRTPTGKSCMDVTSGGVIYMAESPELCERYGKVYEIEVKSAIKYTEQREKQGLAPKKPRYTKGVWVALPENTKIRGIKLG